MINTELLPNMSVEELEALADSQLSPNAQARLDDLLARHAEKQISLEDRQELDRLLRQADQLTILKARARLTLSQQHALSVPS